MGQPIDKPGISELNCCLYSVAHSTSICGYKRKAKKRKNRDEKKRWKKRKKRKKKIAIDSRESRDE